MCILVLDDVPIKTLQWWSSLTSHPSYIGDVFNVCSSCFSSRWCSPTSHLQLFVHGESKFDGENNTDFSMGWDLYNHQVYGACIYRAGFWGAPLWHQVWKFLMSLDVEVVLAILQPPKTCYLVPTNMKICAIFPPSATRCISQMLGTWKIHQPFTPKTTSCGKRNAREVGEL